MGSRIVFTSNGSETDSTWWENDGSPSDGGWTEHTIEGDFDGARHVYAEDVDSDGDIDVLAVANIGDDISWWENTATFSLSPTWTTRSINTAADGANKARRFMELCELFRLPIVALVDEPGFMICLLYTSDAADE